MQRAPSHSLSTSSLLRGVGILRSQTMSLESDPKYQELLAERERLLAACLPSMLSLVGACARVCLLYVALCS